MKKLRIVLVAISCLVAPLTGLAQNANLLTTFTNPTPVAADYFGSAVAAVGADRVLIGAYGDDTSANNAGAAYLFGTDGALLITFTNPAATLQFGRSVAGVGNDRVLIGAPASVGVAYLFSTNGTLLTTFTNPTPAANDYFGAALTAVGAERVLIGAAEDNLIAPDSGVAYMFSTDGALLTTFTNPAPYSNDRFGIAVAAVGSDRVLIGADGDDTGAIDTGAAYLFSTNGTLLTTFTNPTPATTDYFGRSVAALGSDRVLIGAHQDNTGAADAGAAYLFSTNGTLLTTFTNPTPAASDLFGSALAAVGSDRVLIGAFYDDTGATDSGAAYLFSVDGTLLTTITNPTPASSDNFGFSVAAVGSDRVLIGSYYDDAWAINAGAAHLFRLAPAAPRLSITLNPQLSTLNVSWPSPSTDWTLQQNTNSLSSLNWSNVSSGIQDDGTTKTFIINPPTGNRFYRLRK